MERPEVTPYNREHYKVESVDKSGFYTYVPKKAYSELRAQEMCFFINMKPLSIIISLLLCLYLTYCSFQTSLFKELKAFGLKNILEYNDNRR